MLQVGRALKKVIPSVVKREELFITSKLWNSSHKPENVEKELDETLKLLGLEYLDLYRTSVPYYIHAFTDVFECSHSLACRLPSRRVLPSSPNEEERGCY